MIDTNTNGVIATIPVGRSPRALAITNDGDADDLDETLYVPNFFARPRTGFVPPSSANLGGSDDAGAASRPEPRGSRWSARASSTIRARPWSTSSRPRPTPWSAMWSWRRWPTRASTSPAVAFVNTTPGDAPRTIFADGGTDGTQAQPTGAFPNLLQSIALFDGRGFVPNSAASPEPPLRFNLNVQSLVSVFDTDTQQRAHRPDLQHEPRDQLRPAGGPARRAGSRQHRSHVPVGAGRHRLLDRHRRVLGGEPGQRLHRPHGLRRRGQADHPRADRPRAVRSRARSRASSPSIRPTRPARAATRAASCSTPTARTATSSARRRATSSSRISSATPSCSASAPRSFRPIRRSSSILRGKIDFFTSRPFWSDRGWGGCASCHPDGRTDTVTWSFEAGPRQTIDLAGTFSNTEGLADQRLLNWTPVRDENPDFELNTRSVFGGRGFITVNTDINMDGITPDSDPNVHNYGPASSAPGAAAGRHHQLDRVQHPQPHRAAQHQRQSDPRPRHLRRGGPGGANCVACHSGAKWTTSRVTYDPVDVNPVPGTDTGIVNIADPLGVFLNGFNSAAGAGRACEVPAPPGAVERLRIVRVVGTFTATNPIEVRHATPSAPSTPWRRRSPSSAAFGGDGFNTPSLLGVFDSAPYFRNGAAQTLEEAFGIGTDPNFLPAAQAHWRAGTGGDAEHPRQRPERRHRRDLVPPHHRRQHTAVPRRRPGPGRSDLRRRRRPLRLREGSAARHPGARLPALSAFRPGARPSPFARPGPVRRRSTVE